MKAPLSSVKDADAVAQPEAEAANGGGAGSSVDGGVIEDMAGGARGEEAAVAGVRAAT